MSCNRHPQGLESSIVARSLALRLPAGYRIDEHTHPWGQIVYATEGVMTVATGGGAWVVPPHRAAWVPADTVHEVRMTGRVRMRTVYLRPDLSRGLPARCAVLSVSPLLRELVLETVRLGKLRDDVPAQKRLAAVLVDQTRVTPAAPLDLPWPLDERARRVATEMHRDLSVSKPLDALAKGAGAGVRTLERLFVKETGMTFRRWRQRARLLAALHRLAAGEPVTSTALSVGFRSTSAFIAMFRRSLGTTPGNYFRGPGAEAGD